MNQLRIEISNRKPFETSFPECFDEFEARHLKALSRWLSHPKKLEGFPRFIVSFMGLPKRIWKQLTGNDIFYCEIIDGEVVLMPALNYIRQPYNNDKSLVKRIGIFAGPDDRLKNCTLEQVGFADVFANAYANNETPENLNRFFGSLYRPFFLPWRKSLIPAYEFLARFVPSATKKQALLNFQGIMRSFEQIYPYLYKKSNFKSKTERYGWAGTIRQLAKAGIHGDVSKASKLPFPEAMMTFEMNKIEADEAEQRMKRKRS